ncbi:MAG TPA: tetratricopeptide repeat protein [Candidatus Saccharimonadales bacterium]|nr:tetratricopeptide repeat protein [Candidatus Saccharimonadales bacterium]
MITGTRVRPCLLFPVSRPLLGFLLCVLSFVFLLAPSAQAETAPRELLDAGRVDDAIRLLTPQASGGNASALNYLCRAYFAVEDWDNAVRNCERAARLDPNNAIFQLWLGRSYGEKANDSGALSAYSLARKTVAAFSTAHALDRKNVDIARDLAEFYSTAPSIVGGGSDKALALAAELAPQHPSDAAWVRAIVAAHEGNHPQAEHEYNEAIRLDNNSAYAHLEFAHYLKGRKRWDSFQEMVQRAIKSPNIRPADRFDIAELLLSTNRNLPEAAQQIRAYIQSGHTDESSPAFRAHFLLGEILLKGGDPARAASEYRAALALASSYRPAADALRRLGQR